MIVLHDMLSPTPDVATGASLSPRPSQKQDAVSGEHVAMPVGDPGSGRFLKLKRDSVHLSLYA